MAALRSGLDRPVELQAAHLDCPLGRALLWIHRNLVMDVAEGGAPAGDCLLGEGDDAAADGVPEGLEPEHLRRDPRAATYGPLLERRAAASGTEPIAELIMSMRGLDPAEPATAGGATAPDAPVPLDLLDLLVGRDVPPPEGTGNGRRWRTDARIRSRACDLLARWAGAQGDRRLSWIHPDAPMAHLTAVAAVLVRVWVVRSYESKRDDLPDVDLRDLWGRWLATFVGTGRGDGWLDKVGLGSDDVRQRLSADFRGLVTALCWLAVRPGNDLRQRFVAWQPLFTAAMERGVLDASPLACELVSHITYHTNGRRTSRGEVEAQLQACVRFVNDDLWCEQTAERFGLPLLTLETVSTHHAVQVRLVVQGIRDPLMDSRIPQLVAATRRYRRCDGVAVHAGDLDWRLAFVSGAEVAYRPGAGPRAGTLLLSEPISPGTVEQLAATGGVLADLFTAAQIA
jgi:hypothetical protein